MKQLIFNNIQNKSYETPDGIIWDSRSCAVVCHFILSINGTKYILLGKRGEGSDHPNKWNIPCGYFDKNENMQEAFYREVWEETGVDITKVAKESILIFDNTEQPWKVYTNPDENRQNIALHGFIMFKAASLPLTSLANMEENESLEAKWYKLEEAMEIKKVDWAFNHYDRFRELIINYNLL
jgi:8-oxo-dGTP pyrophosphatase MutT (NUDIX family)